MSNKAEIMEDTFRDVGRNFISLPIKNDIQKYRECREHFGRGESATYTTLLALGKYGTLALIGIGIYEIVK